MMLSILVVAIVGLIAYWWANQGATSALLHFLCVLVAGTIAFSLWEWVTVTFFLRGVRFDEYAWGVTLVGIFVVVLFILRLAADKLVPKEVRPNAAVNTVFGAIFGLGAGVLSVGIVLTGWGFVQASTEILGYGGFRRSQESSGQPSQLQGNMPPAMVLEATEFAFGHLSRTVFSPVGGSATLASAMPRFSELAGSGMRDSLDEGKGKISAPRGSIRVADFFELPTAGEGLYVVRLDVEQPAFDPGAMFTLSASQARLVGSDDDSPGVSHPREFGQRLTATDPAFAPFTFSDVTYFASSPSGAQSATFFLAFPKGPLRGQSPAFVQVKGLRLRLPELTREPTVGTLAALLDRTVAARSEMAIALDRLLRETEGAPALGSQHISANNTIDPASSSINTLPGSLVVNDNRWLVSGAGDFVRGANVTGNRDLRVNGILEPRGTRIVRLNASKNLSPVDLYNMDRVRALRRNAGEAAMVEIVDSNGETYQPFGYIWERTGGSTIRVYLDTPPGGRWTLRDLPNAGDEDRLNLLYRLPEGVRVRGVIFRDPSRPVTDAAVAAIADWTVPRR
ncbi:MAG: hypothetical protein KF724_04805 [Phycisphaeraceae bacterium]|nr:hypothetical protein [Phycisphaeraceae bacterium]